MMMTAVICWSMKMRMVQRRAGRKVMMVVHSSRPAVNLNSRMKIRLTARDKSRPLSHSTQTTAC